MICCSGQKHKWLPTKLLKKKFNINNTVLKCLLTLDSSIRIKKLNVVNKLPIKLDIWGDENRCEFIIRNILQNAIKYSEMNKEIEIGISKANNTIDFFIKDHGVGIAEEDLKDIFLNINKHRSTKGTLNEQGSGIGLVLCHDLIESLGWSIHVESEIGKGTTFHILIPQKTLDSIKNNDPVHFNPEFQMN